MAISPVRGVTDVASHFSGWNKRCKKERRAFRYATKRLFVAKRTYGIILTRKQVE
jgi:hypothetical protein